MSKCFHCRREQESFICKKCNKFFETHKRYPTAIDNIRRRPLDPHESLKLQWYRNEKTWEDNIRSRRIVEKNGEKITLYRDRSGAEKVLPSAPKQIWASKKQQS